MQPIENLNCIAGFVRMCTDGYAQNWHERNGGNASYRMTAADVDQARPFFTDPASDWNPLQESVPALAGEYFIITRTGGYMRNMADQVAQSLGMVEIDAAGTAYRVVWGLADGGRPTSEFESHLQIQAVRKAATADTSRVLYHCHPVSVAALTALLPADARTVSTELWKVMTECITVFPEGVGVVPFEVPGSVALAKASAEVMKTQRAALWVHHGLIASGDSFDDAFGLTHVIAKAAEIYCMVRAASPDKAGFPEELSLEQIRQIAQYWHLDAPYLYEEEALL